MKKNLLPHSDEFYIGYVPKAPVAIGSFIKKIIFLLLTLLIIASLLLVCFQKPFSKNNFDYGIPTTLQGRIYINPVPHLKIEKEKAFDGSASTQSVILVGFGKSGAMEILKMKKSKGDFQEGAICTITGNLIYGDLKTVMQVNSESDIVIDSAKKSAPEVPEKISKESISVTGEIVDPKCYFGVMKPGEGKAHRSCAIRCISGGIPPVFHTSSGYFIVVGQNGEPLNKDVLPVVGDVIQLRGYTSQMDDWKILHVQEEYFQNLALEPTLNNSLAAIDSEMTLCTGE